MTDLEKHLVSQTKQILCLMRTRGALFFKRISTTGIPRAKPGGAVVMTQNLDQAGMSDFQVYLPGGVTLHLEAKCKKGKQSEEQVKFEEGLKALGHKYFIFRSIDDLMEILREHGIQTL